MAVDVIVRQRRPTIRFPRPADAEPGAMVSLYWDGSRAPNGDGISGDGAGIDYDNRLVAPTPIWLRGHVHLFGGGFGLGGFAEPGAAPDPSMGFGRGPFGVGAFGIGGGYWEWTFPFALRDGVYRVAVRIIDALGNERETPDATVTLAVEALPRPATRARLAEYDSEQETIQTSWGHSPDFQPTT